MPNLMDYIPTDVWNGIPVLDIGERMGATNYIDFIDPVELGDNGIMRGVDIYGRAFLCIRVEVTCKEEDGHRRIHWVFQTFFQRYVPDTDLWMGAGHFITPLMNTSGGLSEEQCILIARLVCGYRMRIIESDWEIFRFPHELTKSSDKINKCLEMEVLM
jgi:hypothetical protein